MRRTSTLAITLLLATLLGLVTALHVTSAQHSHISGRVDRTPPPPPFSGTPIVGTPTKTGGASFKTLTKQQKSAITKIIKKDKTFGKLVKGKSYKVTSMWVWATKMGSSLGAVVTIRLKKASTLSGTWLDLDYDCSEKSSPPYGRVPYTAKYANVTTMTLFVDSTRKRVAGLRALGTLIGVTVYPRDFKSQSKALSCSTSS